MSKHTRWGEATDFQSLGRFQDRSRNKVLPPHLLLLLRAASEGDTCLHTRPDRPVETQRDINVQVLQARLCRGHLIPGAFGQELRDASGQQDTQVLTDASPAPRTAAC